MDRPLKFRVWDAYLKRMSGPQGLTVSIRDGIIQGVSVRENWDGGGYSEWGSARVPLDQERYKLMQYTGLVDANGAGIFEDDIITDGFGNYVIRYKAPAFYMDAGNDRAYVIEMCRFRDVAVIGNIWQHPVLAYQSRPKPERVDAN